MQTQAFYMRYTQPMEKYSPREIPELRNSYRWLTPAEIILKIAAHVDGLTSNHMQRAPLWQEAYAIASRLDGKMPWSYAYNNKFASVTKTGNIDVDRNGFVILT